MDSNNFNEYVSDLDEHFNLPVNFKYRESTPRKSIPPAVQVAGAFAGVAGVALCTLALPFVIGGAVLFGGRRK